MSRLTWDGTGQKRFETGDDHGVLYLLDQLGAYSTGVAWNGLTAVTESPSGAEPTDLYADNIKYASLRSAETYGATIEAYTYPDEFAECDGSAEIATGVRIGQQERKTFGFSYRSIVGDDTDNNKGYKLHLIYGCTASPSDKSYQTVNESPDAITFSWEITSVPVNVTGKKPTASIEIDSTKANASKLKDLEDILYGDATHTARLPLPDEVASIMGTAATTVTITYTDGVDGSVVFSDQVFTVNKGSVTPSFVGTPTREGYAFTGWDPEVAATATDDATYNATWTAQ